MPWGYRNLRIRWITICEACLNVGRTGERNRVHVRPADRTSLEIRYLAKDNVERNAALTEQSEKISDLRQRINEQELQWAKSHGLKQRGAADDASRAEYKNGKIQAHHKVFELLMQLRDAQRRVEDRPGAGSLPDLFGHLEITLKRILAFLDLPDWEPHAWTALD